MINLHQNVVRKLGNEKTNLLIQNVGLFNVINYWQEKFDPTRLVFKKRTRQMVSFFKILTQEMGDEEKIEAIKEEIQFFVPEVILSKRLACRIEEDFKFFKLNRLHCAYLPYLKVLEIKGFEEKVYDLKFKKEQLIDFLKFVSLGYSFDTGNFYWDILANKAVKRSQTVASKLIEMLKVEIEIPVNITYSYVNKELEEVNSTPLFSKAEYLKRKKLITNKEEQKPEQKAFQYKVDGLSSFNDVLKNCLAKVS